MSLPRYPKYKDSGVEWLGQVPEHWKVRKMKWVAKMESGHTPDRKIAAYWENTDIPWISLNDTGFLKDNDYISETAYSINRLGIENSSARLLPSRVVVFSRDATIGRCAITTKPMAVSQHFIAWVCGDSMVPEYLLLRLRSMTQELDRLTTGATLKTIGMTDVRTLVTPVPPLEEQYSIVSYIDQEKSKIDALIAEQRRLIELLKEKRQAVISHAVTQGLDPNVPMKDSGIEWLGQVPVHWEVAHLNRVVQSGRRITYGIVQPGERDENGRYMVRGQDYSFGWAKAETLFRVSDAVEIPYKRARLKPGDLVVTIVGAGVGNIAVVPDWLDGANLTQTTARVAVDPIKANPRFVCAALQSHIGRRSVEFYAKGAAQPGLNIEHVRVFPITLPPLEEQSAIASFLDTETAKFDTLTTEAERAIELLSERRSALISAAVTGQIDVRNIA